MKEKILITGAHHKHGLASIKHLKKRGFKTIAISHKAYASGFYSRYTDKRFLVANPTDLEKRFITQLIRILKRERPRTMIVVGTEYAIAINNNQDKIKQFTKLIVPTKESFEIAVNKDQTYRFAQKNNIPIPKTRTFSKMRELERFLSRNKRYPIIIKPSKGSNSSGFYKINNRKCLRKTLKKVREDKAYHGQKIIIQEFIEGKIKGFFGLFDKGKLIASFQHERIRQYPNNNGPSTYAKSIKEKELLSIGKRLFSRLSWTGVAMAEFIKENSTNKYKLIEINPRLWGSLELAIESGADFPFLTYQLATGKKIEQKDYKENIIFRWTIPGDILNYIYNRNKKQYRKSLRETHKSDIDWTDPLPTLINLMITMILLIKGLRK